MDGVQAILTTVLNEVLSLNAQEYVFQGYSGVLSLSSMKS